MGDSFNLGDFLSQAGAAYSAYETANATTDAAKLNQQAAAVQAAAAAQTAQASAQTKTYIIYGVLGLFGILIVAFIIKKLR